MLVPNGIHYSFVTSNFELFTPVITSTQLQRPYLLIKATADSCRARRVVELANSAGHIQCNVFLLCDICIHFGINASTKTDKKRGKRETE